MPTAALTGFVAAFVLLCSPASAVLIDFGNITRDTEQGIDWLDLTETNGMTVMDAPAAFPGWDLAIGGQVCGFVQQAVPSGLDPTFYRCGGGSWVQFSGATPPWGTMFNLWGTTVQAGVTSSFPLWGSDETGIAGISYGSPGSGVIDAWMVVPGSNSGSYRSGGVDFNTATDGIGVFLVRPIPEPTTACLVALGLICLAAQRRRATQ